MSDECYRCGETLSPDKKVMLELSFKSGLFTPAGEVPQEESQGCFPFGVACAKRVLKNGGKNERIRKQKKPW